MYGIPSDRFIEDFTKNLSQAIEQNASQFNNGINELRNIGLKRNSSHKFMKNNKNSP